MYMHLWYDRFKVSGATGNVLNLIWLALLCVIFNYSICFKYHPHCLTSEIAIVYVFYKFCMLF